MPDRINIPVTVTGAEQAKAELRGVVSGVQEVKQAGSVPLRDAAGRFATREQAAATALAGGPGAPGTATVAAVAAEQQALAASAEGTQKAASATEQLIAKKRALAAAVALAGGSFGAEVSQLGTLVSLLVTGGPLLGAVAAGLAALAVGVKVFTDIKKAAEEAAGAQREYNEAVAQGQALKREQARGIAEALEELGARSEENIKAARQMQDQLRKDWGIPKERAGEVAAVATAAGLSTEDAVRIATLRGAGAKIDTPEDAKRALAVARGKEGALLETARRNAADIAGRTERERAMAPQVGGTGGVSPERAAYESIRDQPGGLAASGLPANMTFEQFQAAARGAADAMAIARELHPGAKKITQPEFEQAQAVARAATGTVKKYVGQVAGIESGARQPQAGPTLTAHEGVSEAGRIVHQTVNNYNITHKTTNFDSGYFLHSSPEELMERRVAVREGAGIEN